jgi:hypothetical protein
LNTTCTFGAGLVSLSVSHMVAIGRLKRYPSGKGILSPLFVYRESIDSISASGYVKLVGMVRQQKVRVVQVSMLQIESVDTVHPVPGMSPIELGNFDV